MFIQAIDEDWMSIDSRAEKWNPGGLLFNKTVKGVLGSTDDVLQASNGYPHGASKRSNNEIRVEESISAEGQRSYFVDKGVESTILDTQTYLKTFKILSFSAIDRSNVSTFYTSDPVLAAASSSLKFLNLLEKAYDSLRFPVVEQLCEENSPIVVNVSSQTKTLSIPGHTERSRLCRWVFTSSSNKSELALITFTGFYVSGDQGVIVYSGDASKKRPTDPSSSSILFEHRGSSVPPSPIAVILPVVMEVHFLDNASMDHHLLGWTKSGANVLQSVVLTHSITQQCINSSHCTSITPHASCSSSSSQPSSEICLCPDGFSGAFCTLPYCSGNRFFSASPKQQLVIHTTAFTNPTSFDSSSWTSDTGYANGVSCRFHISAPQTYTTSAGQKKSLWGFQLNFTSLSSSIENDKDTYPNICSPVFGFEYF